MTHTVSAADLYEAMKAYWHAGRHRDAAGLAGLLRAAARDGRIRLDGARLSNILAVIRANEREEG